MALEVPCHEALAQKFHAMHPGLDATSAMVSAPSSPERPTKIFRGAQCLVSCDRTGSDGLSRLRVPAGRNGGMGAAIGKRSGALEPGYGMFTARVFWRRDSALKSGTARPRPTRRNRLSTKPVVCRKAMPNSTFIVRHVLLACCRFRGHEDKIVTMELGTADAETNFQPRVQDRGGEAGDGARRGCRAGLPGA